MKEFQDKKRIRKIIFSRFSLAVLLIILIILSISTAKVYLKSRKASLKNDQTIAQIEELEKKKKELEDRIAKLRTGSGLEEEIREKFNVAKPEEKLLTIIDKTPENDKINNEESEKEFFSNLPRFLRGIWDWIKNIF